jgi:hypothetical protein
MLSSIKDQTEKFHDTVLALIRDYQVYCPHIGSLELILESDDSKDQVFKVGSVNFDDCTLFPGTKVILIKEFHAKESVVTFAFLAQEWFKCVLAKFKDNFALVQLRNHRDSNEEWIKSKIDFSSAKDLAMQRKIKKLSTPKNRTDEQVATQNNVLDLMTFLPQMCFVRSPTSARVEKKELERKVDVSRKSEATYLVAKRKLLLSAIDVVRKEVKTAKDFEVLSTMNLSLNHLKFEKVRKKIEGKRKSLKSSLDTLISRIKEVNEKVEKHKKEADRMEKNFSDADKDDKASSAQVKARKKRLEMELARLNPRVAESKVTVAQCTAQLFESLAAFKTATAMHGDLMIAKSEARVRSRLAKERAKAVLMIAAEENNDEKLFALTLEEDDAAELEAVKEPTVLDLQKEMSKLHGTEEKRRLEDAIDDLKDKKSNEEFYLTDLNAETQIARARVDCEMAESVLWDEWHRLAAVEETDKPVQEKGSSILAKAALVDAANKVLRSSIADATKQVGEQTRSKQYKHPDYMDEAPKPGSLASGQWLPSKEVGDMSRCLSRLQRPAERAMAMAHKLLHGPTGDVAPPTSQDLEQVVGELKKIQDQVEESARCQRIVKSKATRSSRDSTPQEISPRKHYSKSVPL